MENVMQQDFSTFDNRVRCQRRQNLQRHERDLIRGLCMHLGEGEKRGPHTCQDVRIQDHADMTLETSVAGASQEARKHCPTHGYVPKIYCLFNLPRQHKKLEMELFMSVTSMISAKLEHDPVIPAPSATQEPKGGSEMTLLSLRLQQHRNRRSGWSEYTASLLNQRCSTM